MPQTVELRIVLGATKELSKDMAGCPVKSHTTKHRTPTLEGDIEPHVKAPEAHHRVNRQHLQGKTCLLGPESHEPMHHEIPPIRSTSLPATEDVAKMHVECCGSQEILGDPTFAVVIVGP